MNIWEKGKENYITVEVNGITDLKAYYKLKRNVNYSPIPGTFTREGDNWTIPFTFNSTGIFSIKIVDNNNIMNDLYGTLLVNDTASILHNGLDSYNNKDNWKAGTVDIQAILDAISNLNNMSIQDIENSTIAKEASLQSIVTSISNIQIASTDLQPVLVAIHDLNNVSASEVRAAFKAADFKDKNTESEIHSWLDSYGNKNSFKEDVSGLSLDVNVVSVKGTPINTIDDFKATVDLSQIPTAVWSYLNRTLSVDIGLTPTQEAKLDTVITNLAAVPTATENATTLLNTQV